MKGTFTRERFEADWKFHIQQLYRLSPANAEDAQRLLEIGTELEAMVEREGSHIESNGGFG